MKQYVITEREVLMIEDDYPFTARDVRKRPLSEHDAELCHIRPDRRGCLHCFAHDCPIWQAADQNCWKSLKEHDAEIRKAILDELERIAQHNWEEIETDEGEMVRMCFCGELIWKIESLRGEP